MRIVSDMQKRYHYNNLSYKGNYIFMATKAPSDMSDALWKQTQEEHEEMLRIIDLKYAGVTLVEQDYLRQHEEEKIEAFIQRISKLN